MTTNTANAVEGPVLTFEYVKAMMDALAKLPPVPVAIVCKPKFEAWCRLNLLQDVNKARASFGVWAIPVYSKWTMREDEEDYKFFYDYEKLKEYLKEDNDTDHT